MAGIDWDGRSGRRPPPVGSLESLWLEYGARIELFAVRALGGDADAVRAACYLTMLEAGRRLLEQGSSPSSANRWPWLARIAHDVCLRVQAPDFDPDSVPAGRLPDALPPRLRALVRWRALRDWVQWRLGRLAGWAALPHPLGRIRSGLGRLAQHGGRRLDVSSTGSATTAISMAAGSGLAEAAAVVAAVVMLGVAAPRGEPPVPPLPRPVPVAGAAISASSAGPEPLAGPSGLPSPTKGAGPDAGESGTAPSPASPVPDAGAPRAAPTPAPEPVPGPTVDAGTSERVGAPVRAQAHDGGNEWSTSDEPATADLESDGDDDLTVQPPVTGVDCPEPQERGVVTGAACPILEAAEPAE